jgi:hypothetical protein
MRYLCVALPKISNTSSPEALEKRYNEAMGYNSSMPAIFRTDEQNY